MTIFCGCTTNTVEENKEPIEITFAHFQGESDAMYNSIQAAIERFENDNSNVRIIQEYYTPDAYTTRVESWNEEDSMRDITMILGSMVEEFAEDETILDLTDDLEDYGISQKISPDYFKELSYDNRVYGIPWEDASYGFILYNKEIFDEVGIESFPSTIEELIEASTRIKEAGYIPMALGNKLLWAADSILFSALVNNYVGNEWYDSIISEDGNAAFTDPEFIEALSVLQQLGESDLFNDNFASIDNEQRGELYQNGEAAMISAGNWELRSTAELVPEIAEATYVALWPVSESGSLMQNSVVSSSAWGMSVSANVEEDKLPYVMDFIANYMCSEEFGRIMAEEQGVFTPWSVEYDTATIDIITQRVQEVTTADNVHKCLNWDSTLSSDVKEVYQEGLQGILSGTLEPEELAERMQLTYEGTIDIE